MTQQRHKHYQQIRAFADGWKIEFFDGGFWRPIENPAFVETELYRTVPDAEGWLPWYATEDGECPVDEGARIEVLFCDGSGGVDKAGSWTWDGVYSPPIRYRIVKEHKTPRAKRTLVKTIKVFSDGSTEEE